MPALKPKPAERQANHKVDLDDAAASNTATDLATEDLGTPGNLSVFQLQQVDTLLKAHSKGDRARALSYQQAPSTPSRLRPATQKRRQVPRAQS